MVHLGIRVADERVIAGLAPAGAIIAVVAHEHVQEGVGIVVIADPTAAAEVVIQFALRSQIGLPFEFADSGMQAEFAPPHVLQLDGDLFVQTRGGITQVFKRGKSLAVGKAPLREELSRQFRIEPEAIRR